MARGNNAKVLITAQDKTRAAFKSVSDRLGKVRSAAFSMQSAIAGAAGAAGFGMLINQAIKSGDALAKTADKLGITTEGLAGLRHAAEQTGVASNTMDMALQRMTRRVAEAAIGTGEAKDAIKQLGLNAKELSNLGPEKAFQKIAGAMEGVKSQGEKVRLAFKLFDSEGVALVNTLALGEDGMRSMAAEAEALGLALSRTDASKLEVARSAMTKIGEAVSGIANRIAVALAPWIAAVANLFTDYAKTARLSNEDVTSGLDTVASAIGFVADVIRGIDGAWLAVKTAFWGMASGVLIGLDSITNGVISFMNLLPGVDLAPNKDTTQWAIAAAGSFEDAKQALLDLVDTPMPSTEIESLLKRIQSEASNVADAIVVQDPTGNTSDTQTAADPAAAKEAARIQKVIDLHQAKFARLADMADMAAMDDETRAIDALDKKINALDAERTLLEENNAFGLEREQAYNDARASIIEVGEKKINDIRQKAMTDAEKFNAKSWDGQVKDVAGSLISMTAGVSSSNRKMFEINKAASIANAIVNTYQGVSGVLAEYPGPVGWAMAAVQVAAGIAQVTKIAGTSFGSKSASGGSVGGSVPSQATSPGTPVTATTQQSAAPQPIRITVINQGDATAFIDTKVIPQIQDRNLNYDVQIISPQSRNAADLAQVAA